MKNNTVEYISKREINKIFICYLKLSEFNQFQMFIKKKKEVKYTNFFSGFWISSMNITVDGRRK